MYYVIQIERQKRARRGNRNLSKCYCKPACHANNLACPHRLLDENYNELAENN
jgi:hypothetical protein